MREPLSFVPTLSLPPTCGPEWARYLSLSFLGGYGGVGHIISPDPLEGVASQEITRPLPGHVWATHKVKRLKRTEAPESLSLWLDIPVGLDHPSLTTLNDAQKVAPIRRVVLQRTAPEPLARLDQSLSSLTEIFGADKLWLDADSLGGDAVSYLLWHHPELNIQGHQALEHLLGLARVLERRIVVRDFSGRPSKALAPLPTYAVPELPRGRSRDMPIHGGIV